MAMHMQSFLNTETELGGRSDLPDEVLLALTAGGWPAIRSSTKLDTQQQQQHEVFVLEFSKEAPAALAPCGPHGSDRSSAKLIIIGTELGRSPIFAVDAPTSAATIERTLALALAAGAAVPKVWMRGEIAKRGALRRLSYVLLENLPAAAAASGLSLPLPVTVGPKAVAGIAWYDDAPSLLREMRRLAIEAGAMELDAPLAKLEAHCTDACGAPTQRCILFDVGGTSEAEVTPEATPAEPPPPPPPPLDTTLFWAGAAVCDARVLHAPGAPWELVRAACHVVKARWLIDLCRREPGTAPRCEVRALLSAHDGAQKLLVEPPCPLHASAHHGALAPPQVRRSSSSSAAGYRPRPSPRAARAPCSPRPSRKRCARATERVVP
jgi:hypothetical protein